MVQEASLYNFVGQMGRTVRDSSFKWIILEEESKYDALILH